MEHSYYLHQFWFVIFIAAMIFYSILDGFDLGVGILNLFNKQDLDRRIFLNAIGPVWDGNEVWLVILVGGLFAGFPFAYASLLSSFYMPVTILIAGLIFRAVAIEFRSKRESRFWRNTWDVCFFLGSLVIAFGLGVCLGNMISGIPLDEEFEYVGTFWGFFHPFAILMGLLAVACFTMHGSIYLVMKTEGALHDKMRRWTTKCIIIFVVFYLITTICTLLFYPHMPQALLGHTLLWIIPVISFLLICNVPLQMKRKNDGWAFISSCLSIALLLILYAIGSYPYLVRSTIEPLTHSVTIFNAGSSEKTLIVLAIVVAIGLPLVFAYGYVLYRVFRGKVKIDKMSY